MRNFMDLLRAKWAAGKFVCVGLDSEFNKIPKAAHQSGNEAPVSIANTIVAFNRAIVEATKDFVCAFKPNAAFYEAYGNEGTNALNRTISDIHIIAPDVPVILDYKRGDIGNTNLGYVKSAFDDYNADAVTVNPYLGQEALQPFLNMKDKGIIVLCRTSNPGAGEFQDLVVSIIEEEGEYLRRAGGPTHSASGRGFSTLLYRHVAYRVSQHWNINGNCALVVGAPYPQELAEIRATVGDMPILIPGVGFQQKNVPLEQQVEQVVTAGQDSNGQGVIINSSRGIIFASSSPDFAEAARRETEKLHNLINQFRKVG